MLTQEEALNEAQEQGWPTFRWGDAQITLMPLQAPHEAYLLNTIVPPQKRGQGHARALSQCIYWIADVEGWTLVAHADSPRLQEAAERTGWHVDESRDRWQGKPCMVRLPHEYADVRPGIIDKLVRVQA